jgi:uncharacterized protein YdhG (YjbR/CyaY superfamily)
MRANNSTPETIADYIEGFPLDVQMLLRKLSATIKKAAPRAEEKISYKIPTYYLHGSLVYFAAYKRHIGFYPGAAAIAKFKKKLSAYKGAKGSVQFPIGEPMPFALITSIVKFRVKANLDKAAAKAKKK